MSNESVAMKNDRIGTRGFFVGRRTGALFSQSQSGRRNHESCIVCQSHARNIVPRIFVVLVFVVLSPLGIQCS